MKEKGKYVTRSAFQKVCEENKRLIKDIEVLVDMNPNPEKLKVALKWTEYFQKDKEFNEMLRTILIKARRAK
jgi:hypothetical protein